MADIITFSKKINDSVQVGDESYWGLIVNGEVTNNLLLGTITGVGDKYIEVGDASVLTGAPLADVFFSFRKPMHADASLPNGGYTNISSLKGYHAEVEFTNSSTSKQELFAVGSEITISSK